MYSVLALFAGIVCLKNCGVLNLKMGISEESAKKKIMFKLFASKKTRTWDLFSCCWNVHKT